MKFNGVQREGPPIQYNLPIFPMSVRDGDPPADDHAEERLDISQLLVVRPDATFFVRVEGEPMDDASIHPGDILVVDRSIKARHKDTVIAVVDGEFMVKVLHKSPTSLRLVSRNSTVPKIESPFEIWGVVLWIVHKAR